MPGRTACLQWQQCHYWMTSCQPVWHTRIVLRNVAVVVVNGFLPFEFGTICEVFGVDRADDRLPPYELSVVAGEPPPVRAHNDFTINPSCGLERLEEARSHRAARGRRRPARHLRGHAGREAGRALALPRRPAGGAAPGGGPGHPGAEHLHRRVHPGRAGLLDGRRCTTHWRCVAQLARCYPAATVDPDVLFVDEGPVITSAGTAAGIDACLYLVSREQGSRIANGIARRMVVPPHRDGGQAQYVDLPVAPACDGTRGTCSSGCACTSTSRSPCDSWPRGRTCPRAPSPGASCRRPARRRSAG